MNDVKKVAKINRLMDLYGSLLTKSQYDIMSDYYFCDLSLSEISELRKISRTAVADALKKSLEKLENFEKKLGLCRVFDSFDDEQSKVVIAKIEERIKDGI